MIHDIIKNDLFSDIKSEKLKTDIVFRMSFRSSKQLLQLQWFIYLLLITPMNPSGLIILCTLKKHQVISSATKQSHFLTPKKVCKIPKCQYIPFQILRCIWENIFFFCNRVLVETKEGEHIRKQCTAPFAMTSSCNVSIYLYLGMVYMFMYMSHTFLCILACLCL